MKIIRTNIIPFKGFAAVNIFGILFARKDAVIDRYVINHEQIHTAQMKEMLYLFFYLWYFTEWLIRLIINGKEDAYHCISFEREAWRHDLNLEYLSTRKHFFWMKYLYK